MTIATFWTLKKQWTVVFVMLLLLGWTLPLATAASPKSSCPTTGKTVMVFWVDSNPRSAAVGTTVVTEVVVHHTDETWFALSPQTISFRWVSTAGEKIVENAPVVPLSTILYKYEQKVGDDFPTGTVTIFVVACSCSDGQGNSGPPSDVSSDSTEKPDDNSRVEIGATMQPAQPTTQELLAAYSVPIVIAIVLIVALLLLVLRTRKKKT